MEQLRAIEASNDERGASSRRLGEGRGGLTVEGNGKLRIAMCDEFTRGVLLHPGKGGVYQYNKRPY